MHGPVRAGTTGLSPESLGLDRREATVGLPTVQAVDRGQGCYFAQPLRADDLGRVGEVSPEGLALPLA